MNPHEIDAQKDADALIDLLSCGGVFPLAVTGSSMIPFLKEGRDTVHLQKTNRFYKGQIVFFRRTPKEFVLHRVRKVLPDGRLLLNGDAQNWYECIGQEQVLAEVILIEKNGKKTDPNGKGALLLRALWYPTVPLRPLLWKCYGGLRGFFKKAIK
jgi:hypothetical protein